MVAVSEISWEEVAAPAFGNPARTAWREAVQQVATKAHEKLPASSGRIDRAVKLVLAGDVEVLPDGTARVASQSNGTTAYQVVNGHCGCRDYEKAPHAFCKHRLGAAIARRAQDLLQAQQHGQVAAAPAAEYSSDTAPAKGITIGDILAPALLPESLLPYVVHIKGKAFIQYGGLLTLAHSRGLVSLKVDFISVTSELALARAKAVFADGRVYAECADATPGNVGAQVRPHFPRLALTRAKARTLRDALGITMVALEELGGED